MECKGGIHFCIMEARWIYDGTTLCDYHLRNHLYHEGSSKPIGELEQIK